MHFHQPVWLILAIPILASLWWWQRGSRILRILHFAYFACLLLGLAELALTRPDQAGTIVVVADRSHSMPPGSDREQIHKINALIRSKSAHDMVAVVTFGERAAVEHQSEAGELTEYRHLVQGDASNLNEAIDLALSLIPLHAPGRILVMSDGRWTGRDPTAAVAHAATRNIAIDYHLQRRRTSDDLALSRIDAPATIAPGEAFNITAWIQAPSPMDIEFEIDRNNASFESGKMRLNSGFNRLAFRDRALERGVLSYSIRVKQSDGRDAKDPLPENNRGTVLIGVHGPKPLLFVSGAAQSNTPQLIRKGGLKLEARKPEEVSWSLRELSAYSGLVLENVSAARIGHKGLKAIAVWVEQTGAGLMITGGKNSYSTGGYRHTALEPILPVTLEQRREHRKLLTAIVVALDRSGSMTAPAGSGRRKIDLANEGTVQVLDLLSSQDEFGVLAVDTAAHLVAPLQPAGDKSSIRSKVLRIESEGGGIFVYQALLAAEALISKATAATRHIILFADADDAEEPGDYKKLLAASQANGITVSVIGLGTPHSADAEFLRDVAVRGGGRIFFTSKAEELPKLFQEEALVVARSTFVDQSTNLVGTEHLRTLTGKNFKVNATSIGGYNLCYLRPDAPGRAVKQAIYTDDEYRAPIVAAWQAGLGRVLCYTGETDGSFTGNLAEWSEVGEFLSSLARWTAGESTNLKDNMLLTQEVRNGVQSITLHLDPERESDPFSSLPQATLLREEPGSDATAQNHLLRWTGPDMLTLEVPLRGSETSLGTVQVPGNDPIVLPPTCLLYSAEHAPGQSDTGRNHLEQIARSTNGKEQLIDVASTWTDLPKTPRTFSLALWFILTAVVLILAAILERRTGLLSRGGQLVWEKSGLERMMPDRWPSFRRRSVPVSAAEPDSVESATATRTAKSAVPDPEPADDMLDALRKARSRSQRRQ